MKALNRGVNPFVSLYVFAGGLIFFLVMAPGVAMAGHPLFGPPHAQFGLNEKTTGQVGALYLWFVDDADPNSIAVADPSLKTDVFIKIEIPSWTANADALPGINAEGHLLNLPGSLLSTIYKDADSGYAAPLYPEFGGASFTFGSSSPGMNYEYLGLYGTAGVYTIAPIDVDTMEFNEKGLDTAMFEVHPIRGAGTDLCIPDSTVLCLDDGRFKVEAAWKGAQQDAGIGRVLDGGTDDQGAFWFFDYTNMEIVVKVLDGCPTNDHFWVFASANANVEYTLTVTDTETGRIREYTNPLGSPAEAITDTQAFATCP